MATYVALLRGINVGGHNKIAMADLRRIVEGLGHSDVVTYVNSGNVVLDTTGRASAAAADRIADGIAKAITAETGLSPAVLVRTAAELRATASANPYTDQPDPKLVHVVFLADPPTAAGREGAERAQAEARERGSDDELTIIKRAVYLHTPGGFGRSVLAELLARKRKDAPLAVGTARNWSTVTKLVAMCDER